MNKNFIIALLCAFSISHFTTNAQNNNRPMDNFSYSVGVLIAKSLKDQGIDNLNMDDFMKGLNEQLKGTANCTVEQATQAYSKGMQEVAAKKNGPLKEAGEKFLAENKTKPGVVTTTSGLQYQVIKMGDGAKPGPTSKVKVHYHGTLPDGKVFDSSVERGEPISFPLNGVIPGWTEGVQLMPVGSKFKFFIPYNLAYGERGAGADIKPFSALVFEVELLAIE
ncbi:MAG: FKBP-type peptidyl-prolyl cis-trans isomerase [Saprospiraceae bacterium]|nr:FKBP-type peptidyl-prolyl cis-trans isomerase [Saprospiraceae bacterium]